MKEASGELSMTVITIIAVAAILGIISIFLPGIMNSIGDNWNQAATSGITNGEGGSGIGINHGNNGLNP